jgi:energy-converting hydrogenase Eha subunit F
MAILAMPVSVARILSVSLTIIIVRKFSIEYSRDDEYDLPRPALSIRRHLGW